LFKAVCAEKHAEMRYATQLIIVAVEFWNAWTIKAVLHDADAVTMLTTFFW
jgi:hypothetical protein